MGAGLGALMTAYALICNNSRLTLVVLLHLSSSGAAAHADVLQRSSETCGLMALEVGEGNEDVCIHDGLADLCIFHIFSTHYRYFHIVVTLKSICNDYMGSCGERAEAI